jgi:hypothetical protein
MSSTFIRAIGTLALACLPALFSAPAHALRGGETGSDHDWVGTLSTGGDGVLIAPNWVLTAAHVARTGGSFQTAAGSAPVAAVFKAGTLGFPDDDLALLYLGSALDVGVLPRVYGNVLHANDAIAYGAVTLVAAQDSNTQQYVHSALVTAYPHFTTEDGVVHTTWYVVAGSRADTSPLLQGGDSGSGLFAGHLDGHDEALLMGIASATCNTRYSCFVQPAAYREWIDSTMNASGQDVQWSLAPVPEPSTWVLLGAGLVMIATWRGRIRARFAWRTGNPALTGGPDARMPKSGLFQPFG